MESTKRSGRGPEFANDVHIRSSLASGEPSLRPKSFSMPCTRKRHEEKKGTRMGRRKEGEGAGEGEGGARVNKSRVSAVCLRWKCLQWKRHEVEERRRM